LSIVLLLVSLLGVLAGGWLTGRLGFGLAVIADSVAVAAWALLRDDGGQPEPQVHGVPTLSDVLEKARRSA
jgi:predicted PurR-regulated permease PerM